MCILKMDDSHVSRRTDNEKGQVSFNSPNQDSPHRFSWRNCIELSYCSNIVCSNCWIIILVACEWKPIEKSNYKMVMEGEDEAIPKL